jgi:hypothetical protein
MAGGGVPSTSGKNKPATSGTTYGRQVLESTTEAERIFSLGIESTSVLIQANPNNSDVVYVGWDNSVDADSGVILEAGTSISLDVDLSQQNVFALPASADDDVRFLVME